MKPEMSCNEITDRLLEVIDNYDVVILNYANGDMLGHTGIMEAAIKAVEVVDANLGCLYNRIKELGGLLIVTADHGNCEYMLDENNNIVTSHTTNPVPFIVCDKSVTLKNGKLGDIAPTMLKIMHIEIPKEMTGNVLI
jgi:2,3-bisphosphoglycerate-independent phosphoglycerate mutase